MDLAQLVREVVEGLETQASEADVKIAVSAEGEAIVTGDRNELYEVFENLIDNAINYGGDGGAVEVAVRPGRGGYHYAGDRDGPRRRRSRSNTCRGSPSGSTASMRNRAARRRARGWGLRSPSTSSTGTAGS